jgi:dynactin complex subunit
MSELEEEVQHLKSRIEEVNNRLTSEMSIAGSVEAELQKRVDALEGSVRELRSKLKAAHIQGLEVD